MISSRVFPLHSRHTANCFCRYFGNITSDISCIRTKVCITKSEISMRTWRSLMSAALQGAFVDISGILKKDLERIKVFHDAVNLTAVCYSSLEASSAAAFSTSSTTTGASSASEDFLSFFGITFFGASYSTV